MATFVKLTKAHGRNDAIWVNLDLIREMERVPARTASEYNSAEPDQTALWFDGSGASAADWDRSFVLETPEQIVAMLAEHRLANGGAS